MTTFKRAGGWVFICFLFGLVAAALTFALPAQAEPLPFLKQDARCLTPFIQSTQIGQGVRYTQTDVTTPDALTLLPPDSWQTNNNATISLGFQTQPYWFVIDFCTRNDITKYWILELANPMIDRVWVYIYENGQQIDQWETGDFLPFIQRPLVNARFQFPLQLQENSEYQVYLRVESTEALELPLTLTDRFYHAVINDRRSMVDGIFLGFLIIMAAYSLAIFVILRDRPYLFYVCYVVSMLLFFLSQQGLLYEYAFPSFPRLQHYSVPLVSLLIFMSMYGFFHSFLQFKNHLPRLWRIYEKMVFFHAILCVALFVLPYQIVVGIMALNVVISMLIAMAMIIILSVRGSRPAQIVFTGWGMLFLFIWLFVLARTGVFYNDFLASYGLRLGVSLEILIFSFALSFRINQERKEKEWALNKINFERIERIRAQDLALEREVEARQAREESLQLEIKHRESLQQLVDERTADLEKTLLDLERANRELEQLSARDSLTGLFNRRVFDQKILEMWSAQRRRNEPLSLLLLDVDHFKHINDTKGHPCGDMVLKELAALLGTLLHRPNDVIARYGGEEFAVLLPETPLSGAVRVAETIVKTAAAKRYQWDSDHLHATVSIGVHTLVPNAENDTGDLIHGADHALYHAKHTGRNRYAVCDSANEPDTKSCG